MTAADDGVQVECSPPPRGMLQYVTDLPRWYVTLRGSGPQPRVEVPTRVDGIAGEWLHTRHGWRKPERVIQHYREVMP